MSTSALLLGPATLLWSGCSVCITAHQRHMYSLLYDDCMIVALPSRQQTVASSDQSVFLFAGYTQVLPPVCPGPADHLPSLGSYICALPNISKERSPAPHVISAQFSRASAACKRGVYQSHGPCASEEAEHTCV